MENHIRLYPNNFNGGEGCCLYVEGLSKPETVLNKKCIIRIYEMDTVSGKSEKPGSKDLLAEFETTIVAGVQKNRYYFNQSVTKRTDTFPSVLPGSEFRVDGTGNLLPVPVKFKPAYFIFSFDNGAIHPTTSYHIHIRGDSKELEYYNYEISFSLEIEGKEIFNSYKMQAMVDCNDILAENCMNTANFFKDNHDGMLASRRVGTHYGNKYKYVLPNEDSFLREAQRELHLSAEQVEALRGNKNVWDENEKKKFDTDKNQYKLKETSCIDYVLDCLEIAHRKAGMEADWKFIAGKVIDKIGQSLAKELVNYGWVALYYNPDVKNPWDKQKIHTDSYNQAITKKTYGSDIVVPVFDLVVNYAPQPEFKDGSIVNEPTHEESDQIAKLLEVPYAFLMGRDSLHTAMLIKGKVFEVHWDIGPYYDVGKKSAVFSNACDFVFDYKRRDSTWAWLSGLIVIPKMFWPKARYKL